MSSARRRALVGVVVGALLSLSAVAGVALFAHSSECSVGRHDDLTIEELITVKKRFEAYRAEPSAGLQLTGPELGMVLEDPDGVPLFVEVAAGTVRGALALPAFTGGCWPVQFEGKVSVRDARVEFVPNRIQVGEVDVSGWYAGRPMTLSPADMPSQRTHTLLEQTLRASVSGDHLEVHLADPATFRWH